MKFTTITILPALAIVAAAPAQEERRFPVPPFSAVDVAGLDDVTIRRGPAVSVSAFGSAGSLGNVRVAVRDGTLFLASPGTGQRSGVRFEVELPDLRRVRAGEAGIVTVADAKGRAFTGEMTGTGQLVVTGADETDTKVSLHGGGEVRTTVRSETRASANGAGGVTITRGARCTVLDGAPVRIACN